MCDERHICIDGTKNFRDLGGYLTSDGQSRTKWRHFYRSDHLGNASNIEKNIPLLRDTLNIGCIIDFRSAEERKEHPYTIPGILVYKIPIEMGNRRVGKAHDITHFTREHAEAYMIHLYEQFVRLKSVWKTFFRILVVQSQKDYALLFHCKAGKDRTGFCAALLLLALGVSLDVVCEDFLLSNKYFNPPPTHLLKCMNVEQTAVSALCTVRHSYLMRAIELICDQFGSVRNYLETEIGLTAKEIDLLKQGFLEKV